MAKRKLSSKQVAQMLMAESSDSEFIMSDDDGHVVCMDNFYTSPWFASQVRSQRISSIQNGSFEQGRSK